jgi:protoporphyrinogen/coproporphyrinogen III oxidase
MSRIDPWIVVGGGASGLATAFFLKRLGLDAVVVERDGGIGGRMGTVRLGDRLLDCGGKNIGRQYTLFRRFAASLGTHPFEPFGLNSSQRVDGRTRTFEASARWRSFAGLVRGLSPNDVMRFGRLLGRVKYDQTSGYLGSPYARALGERYDAAPVDRHFSRAFCERIIRPMTVRMNGAEPDEVYMGTLTSNVRMLLDTYDQFSHGLAPVLQAFLWDYDVRLETAVEALVVEHGRVTGVQTRNADGSTSELRGAGVVLATPAHAAAALAAPVLPGLADQLRRVAYHPVTLVLAEYDRPIFSSSCRAFVFGEQDALSNAGAYGINDLNIVRYTFSGRSSRAIADPGDGDALTGLAEATLSRYVAVDRRWRRRFVAKRFSPGLCAYTRHHGEFLDRLQIEADALTGLYVTGDYIQGASIEACFRSASACARRIVRREQLPASPDERRWSTTDQQGHRTRGSRNAA